MDVKRRIEWQDKIQRKFINDKLVEIRDVINDLMAELALEEERINEEKQHELPTN